MKTYTPAELRALADSRHTNPFVADQARAAMHYAANVLEAADAAVTAERQRAEQRAEQGDAKDARFLHWTTDVGYVEIWLSKIDHLGFVQPISGPWRCPADFAVAILASKGAA